MVVKNAKRLEIDFFPLEPSDCLVTEIAAAEAVIQKTVKKNVLTASLKPMLKAFHGHIVLFIFIEYRLL
jgi:hypothetical protein